jgi:hypothetical protein
MEKTEGIIWHNSRKLNVIQQINEMITLTLLASEAIIDSKCQDRYGFNLEGVKRKTFMKEPTSTRRKASLEITKRQIKWQEKEKEELHIISILLLIFLKLRNSSRT